jgi:hypothetical protein
MHICVCVADWPTKTGIALSPQRWVSLLRLSELVKETAQDIKEGKDVDAEFHVSGPIFLTMKSPFHTINIRQWFMKDGIKRPSTKGIVLHLSQWEKLLRLETKMETCLPLLKGMLPCYFSKDHASQIGGLECTECNPF